MKERRLYWWAYGMDMQGRPAVAGWYNDDEEARREGTTQISGLVQVIQLPTCNMVKAKSFIKYILAKQAGSVDVGLRPMRGFKGEAGKGQEEDMEERL